jgi:hypothetical protein
LDPSRVTVALGGPYLYGVFPLREVETEAEAEAEAETETEMTRRRVGATPTGKSEGRGFSGRGCRVRILPVKKFLVFTYYAGRPLGGAKDFLADFESVEEALDNILEEPTRYYQIVNSETMRVRKEGLARFKDFDSREFRREAR